MGHMWAMFFYGTATALHRNYECFAPFAREEVILTKVRVIKREKKKSAKGVKS